MASPLTPLGRLLQEHGFVQPPRLQTDESRSASRLELFFDLAFVLVVAELAGVLREGVTVPALLRTAGLFAVVWWAWMSSTLYANRFDHDDVLYRVVKLAGMLAVVGMAASVAEATGARATAFVLSYVALRVLLLLQYVRAYRHVDEARGGIRAYLLGTGAGAALWAASLAVEGPPRYVLWAVGLLVDLAAPLLVTASSARVPLHLEHLPERFSLFVILVLGESVAAVADGVLDAAWDAAAVATAVICFVLVAALWWSWFDLAGARARQLLDEAGDETSTVRHDVYVYSQLPLTLALAAVGAGVHSTVVEGTAQASTGTRALLTGGVALYLLTVAITNTGMERAGLARRWSWAVLAAGVAVVDGLVQLPALVVSGVLALLLCALVVVGMREEALGRLDVQEV